MYPIDNWDKDNTVWNGLKELGVDAVLVGHDHEVSASVVYDGVRCQFGLKSSTYDSNIYVNENGKLVKSWVPAGTPMIGGTVMELAPDGEIAAAYHYYCKNVSFER
jgi:hypothetical protein